MKELNPYCLVKDCTECRVSPITYTENDIIVTIPKYVFEADKESAEEQGKELFAKLWNVNPELREKNEQK